MIAIRDLTKLRSKVAVLEGVNLDVPKGGVTSVIGPSGGGKSTLLRCINGLERFDKGSILVEELELKPGIPAKPLLLKLRRFVGMVFQQFNLFPHMNVLQNVMAGPRFVLGQTEAEAEPSARELLRRVGLGEKCEARPDQLSGGQQQRVAIARALAVKPAAILFDEPTSALDPQMALEVLSVITDLARSGQTMIVVTHAMDFARRVAHQVVVMAAGRIIECGTPEAVFDNPQNTETRAFLHRG